MVNVSKSLLIKIVEVILVCVLIGLHHNYPTSAYNGENFVSTGTFVGYLIILVGLIAGGFMGTPVNRRVELFYLVVGCALFIAAGSMIVDRYKGPDGVVAKGSISIITGIIFFIDALLTFKGDS